MEAIVKILFGFIFVLFEGLFLMVTWNWVAPHFWTGAPHLSFGDGVSIYILLHIIGSAFRLSKKDFDK
jgi:hypothetical protein